MVDEAFEGIRVIRCSFQDAYCLSLPAYWYTGESGDKVAL